MKRTIAVSLVVIVVVSIGLIVGFREFTGPLSCARSSTATTSVMRSQLPFVQFGAVRKYKLPSGRSPNAITVATDGSVWFGEQAVPGIGHLYTNGTLVEYAWPFQYRSPAYTYIWGIADWDGCVWASDQAGSQLVAVDPNTGRVKTIQLTAGSFPYTLTVAPDNTLWFTEAYGLKIASIDTQLNLHEYPIPELGTPAQIAFANNSLAYYVDAGNVGLAKTGIYSFNPNNVAPTLIDASTNNLVVPTSLALMNDGIWVAEHDTSDLAYYNFSSHQIIQFPTTSVSYISTTLPYFVQGNGSLVWFNEHYGNRMGVIDTKRDLLTEYSLSNPPANKTTQIDNALTFAVGGSRVWFTELTADYVGYIDATYKPPYSFQPTKATLELPAGKSETTSLSLQGVSDGNLTITASDSSALFANPQMISLSLGENSTSPINGEVANALTVTLSTDAVPGQYEILITAAEGLIGRGVYVTLVIVD
jgi:streptogramin lyase